MTTMTTITPVSGVHPVEEVIHDHKAVGRACSVAVSTARAVTSGIKISAMVTANVAAIAPHV